MIVLPSEFKTAIETPHQSDPWLWLWEFVLDDPAPPTSPTWANLTPYPTDVTWTAPPRAGYPGGSTTFSAFKMEQGPIEVSGEGNLSSMEVALDNTARFLMSTIEGVDLEGNRATLWLLNSATVATIPGAYLEWNFRIVSATVNRTQVSLRLEMPNFFDRRVPTETYQASRCRWLKFGGRECGYVISPTAAYSTCDRTLDQCVARGDDEVVRGLPRLHPRRFGGFPGIPTQRIP